MDYKPLGSAGRPSGRHPGARYSILKVCSLYCAPCAESYKEINRWLMAQYEVDIKIFFTTRNDQNDKSFLPTRHLMALYQEGAHGNFNECLQDWFTKGRSDPQGFLSRHACAKTDDAVDLQIEEMHQWCKANEIQYTSTYFVNGHRLPPAYRLKDLQYFLLT